MLGPEEEEDDPEASEGTLIGLSGRSGTTCGGDAGGGDAGAAGAGGGDGCAT